MKPLSKGDACRVRLHTGEVVEAVYDEPMKKRRITLLWLAEHCFRLESTECAVLLAIHAFLYLWGRVYEKDST